MISGGDITGFGTGVIGAVGKIVVDVVLMCERLPEADEHQNVQRLVTAGGAAANVTAQLAARGRRTILAGWQGADADSASVAADLHQRGVTLRTVARGQAPVATVVAWDGDRAFLVDQGDLSAQLDDVDDSWLDGMSVVHLNGFELLDYCWPGVLVEVTRLGFIGARSGLRQPQRSPHPGSARGAADCGRGGRRARWNGPHHLSDGSRTLVDSRPRRHRQCRNHRLR